MHEYIKSMNVAAEKVASGECDALVGYWDIAREIDYAMACGESAQDVLLGVSLRGNIHLSSRFSSASAISKARKVAQSWSSFEALNTALLASDKSVSIKSAVELSYEKGEKKATGRPKGSSKADPVSKARKAVERDLQALKPAERRQVLLALLAELG